MHLGSLLLAALAGAALSLSPQSAPKASKSGSKPAASAAELDALAGTWYYAGDLTPDRTPEERGTNYGSSFVIRLEKDAFVLERPGGDPSVAHKRFSLDGSARTETENDVKVTFSGRRHDGSFTATTRTDRPGKEKREVTESNYTFTLVADGLHLTTKSTGPWGGERLCLYRRKEQIEPRDPIAAKADALAWLAGNWTGTRRTSTIEERWSEPAGGAMLGTSRTVNGARMTAFEFLPIVEKDGKLLYIAQPGGRTATEFILVELEETRAVFENPYHDHPQRISYERIDEQLAAEISFIDGGSPQRFDFKRAN
jgi:hypothetical protein